MSQNKQKLYSKNKIMNIVASALTDVIIDLEDASLLVVGTLVMKKLDNVLK